MNKIDELQSIIDNSKNIVFFSGAGISTLSGLKDFRGKDGLYKMKYKYNVEEMLSHHFFMNNLEEFYDFYKTYFNIDNIKPNIIHNYLVKLEDKKKVTIITQNIDNLHSLAGSKNVLELHGNITRNYCMKCNKFYGYDYVFKCKNIPKCECGGIVKPDVVLYEEELDYDILDQAISALRNADTLIVAGTSLSVYPASGLVRYFGGKNLVIINNSTTLYDNMATLVINEDLEKVFNKLK